MLHLCLCQNPIAVVKQIATFLGKDFDQSQLEKVVDHCSFKKMQKNPAANWMEPNGLAKKNRKTDFFRKGAYNLFSTQPDFPVVIFLP